MFTIFSFSHRFWLSLYFNWPNQYCSELWQHSCDEATGRQQWQSEGDSRPYFVWTVPLTAAFWLLHGRLPDTLGGPVWHNATPPWWPRTSFPGNNAWSVCELYAWFFSRFIFYKLTFIHQYPTLTAFPVSSLPSLLEYINL